MSDTEGQDEPSMEEILASIRKIISEDDVEEEKTDEEPEAEKEMELVEEPDSDEDVLELTDEVEEEPEAEEEPEPAPEPEPEPAPEPEPEPEETAEEMAIDDVDPAMEEDVLSSGAASDFAMDQFGVLSDLLTTGYQGAGNTLEDLVREMLRPMLKEWLDQNLPAIVERMIAKEMARLARTKKP